MGPNGFYLALDAGGTAVKVAIYDSAGREVAAVGHVLTPSRPAPGHVERDLEQSWDLLCGLIRTALTEGNLTAGDIRAIGLTGFGNGLIALDHNGTPVRPAILSSDTRAEIIIADWLGKGVQDRHLELTHQRLWSGKPLALLNWLKIHEPKIFEKIRYILSCKDYLRFKLTDAIGFEIGDASSASIVRTDTRKLATGLFADLGLEKEISLIPPIIETLSTGGTVTAKAASETSLRAGTPVSAGYADGPAMMLALGAVEESDLAIISGTWGLNQVISSKPINDGSILATMASATPDKFVLVDGSANSASVLQWMLDRLLLPVLSLSGVGSPPNAEIYRWVNDMVMAVDPKIDLPIFCPNINGSFDNAAGTGSIHGLRSYHGVQDMLRAVTEGIAFEHLVHIRRLQKHSGIPSKIFMAGGASRSEVWVQIFADLLQRPVLVSQSCELGAHGAAILAATTCGDFKTLDAAIYAMMGATKRIYPNAGNAQPLLNRFERYRTLRQQI